MAVLEQMGINGTLFIQIAIFIITITILSTTVFSHYVEAVHERKNRTKGGEELATEIYRRAVNLKSDYENQVKSLNQEIKDVFTQKRLAANLEVDKILSVAKQDAQEVLLKSRAELQNSLLDAQETIQGQSQELAILIAQKTLGKK